MSKVFTQQESDRIRLVKGELQHLINSTNSFDGYFVNLSNLVIAGGYFASKINEESVNDIDVFILNEDERTYNVLTHRSAAFAAKDIARDWRINADAKYLNNPHVKSTAFNKKTKFQYILTDHKSRKDLIDDFDLVHCTVSYAVDTGFLYITRQAYDCIINKELRKNRTESPVDWRNNKFISRGWRYTKI